MSKTSHMESNAEQYTKNKKNYNNFTLFLSYYSKLLLNVTHGLVKNYSFGETFHQNFSLFFVIPQHWHKSVWFLWHRRVKRYLNSLREDEESCEDEKKSVDEARQNLSPYVPETQQTRKDLSRPWRSPETAHTVEEVSPVGEAVVGPPPGDDGGCEACQQGGAVEEHVEGVWYQT